MFGIRRRGGGDVMSIHECSCITSPFHPVLIHSWWWGLPSPPSSHSHQIGWSFSLKFQSVGKKDKNQTNCLRRFSLPLFNISWDKLDLNISWWWIPVNCSHSFSLLPTRISAVNLLLQLNLRQHHFNTSFWLINWLPVPFLTALLTTCLLCMSSSSSSLSLLIFWFSITHIIIVILMCTVNKHFRDTLSFFTDYLSWLQNLNISVLMMWKYTMSRRVAWNFRTSLFQIFWEKLTFVINGLFDVMMIHSLTEWSPLTSSFPSGFWWCEWLPVDGYKWPFSRVCASKWDFVVWRMIYERYISVAGV